MTLAILLIVLVPAAMTVAAGALILVLVAALGRGEPDPEGRRGEGIYLGAVAFVAMYMAIFATFGVVTSLASLLSPRPSATSSFSSSSSGVSASTPVTLGASTPLSSSAPGLTFRQDSPQSGLFQAVSGPSRTDEATTGAVASGLVALGALGVLAFHRRRLQEALSERGHGLLARVMMTYRRLVSFVGVFIVALAGAVALFGVYRLIAPGMSGSSGRSGGLEELIDAGYLALVSAGVVLLHRPTRPQSGVVDLEP